jgi:hypothetical protein
LDMRVPRLSFFNTALDTWRVNAGLPSCVIRRVKTISVKRFVAGVIRAGD